MSNAERLEELIEQAERAHGLPVLRVQPTQTLLKAIDSEIVEPLEKRIVELEAQGEKREAELIRQVDIVIDLQQYIAEQEKIILAGAQMYNAEREVRGKAEAHIAELEAQIKNLQRQREIDNKLIDELRADIADLTEDDEDEQP